METGRRAGRPARVRFATGRFYPGGESLPGEALHAAFAQSEAERSSKTVLVARAYTFHLNSSTEVTAPLWAFIETRLTTGPSPTSMSNVYTRLDCRTLSLMPTMFPLGT